MSMDNNRLNGKAQGAVRRTSDVFMTMLEYLWALFLILNGNSVFHASSARDFKLLEISVFLTFLLLIFNFLLRRIRATRLNVVFMIVILLYCTLYLSVMQMKINAGVFIKLFLLGGPAMFLLFVELHRQGRLMKLMERFVNILCVLAVVSLVFWYLGVIAKVIQPNMYIPISWGNFTYAEGFYGVHYAFQLDTTFFPEAYIYRNSGIFAEAPMFNLWLDFSLAIELFLKEKPSKFKVVLLIVTILTTMSVTGILFVVICLGLTSLINFKEMKLWNKGMLLIVALVAVPAMAYLLVQTFILKGDTQSFEMRLSDYTGGARMWIDYPLFGAGFGNLKALKPYVYSPDGAMGFSNSIMAVLSTGGAWMAVVYYVPHIAMLFPQVTGSKKYACFGWCMLFLFCTTIFFARLIGVLVIMLGYALMVGKHYVERNGENTSR